MRAPLLRRQLAVVAVGLVAVAGAVTAALANPGSDDPSVSADAPPATQFALTIGRPVGRPIPPGFLGLSIEFPAVRSYTGADPAHVNPVLVQLIRNLSGGQPPVIRIGGDSTDGSWVPTAGIKPPPQVVYSLTPSWFATTAALVRALGAKVTVGINLGANDPALAAAEARADVRAFGPALAAFEIGNEPNVYGSIAAFHTRSGRPVRARPRSFGSVEYLHQFKAVAALLPPRPLAGPALTAGQTPGRGSWINTLPGLMKASPRLRILTIHRYPLRNCFVAPTAPAYPTIPNLLSNFSTAELAAGVQPWIALAHRAGRTLRLDELNSVACRGKEGVSNTFASALWAIDALFSLARVGVDGVNVHTLPGAAYALFYFRDIDGGWKGTVAPEYYGLDLFARAAPPGSRLLAVSGQRGGRGVAVWATRAPDRRVRAMIDNESSRTANVRLQAPAGTAGPAAVVRMVAPSVSSQSGVTIGGASFGTQTDTGVLPQPQEQTIHRSAGAYTVVVPPDSAALVTFSR